MFEGESEEWMRLELHRSFGYPLPEVMPRQGQIFWNGFVCMCSDLLCDS